MKYGIGQTSAQKKGDRLGSLSLKVKPEMKTFRESAVLAWCLTVYFSTVTLPLKSFRAYPFINTAFMV